MLKSKNIAQNSGAEHLADIMASIASDEKKLNVLELRLLDEAPSEWNFFAPLPDSKFFELIESIEENGLLVPLIVWQKPSGRYTLLSGHNRKRALLALYEKTQSPQYLSAPCAVYRNTELDERQAKSIIVDCNWVQRNLSPGEKAKAIKFKYVEMDRLKRGSGKRRYDLVAEHFGLRATQVYQYYRLADLERYWLNLLDAGKISIKAAVKLASLKEEQREYLKEIFEKKPLNNKQILSLEPGFSMAQTRKAISGKSNNEIREVTFQVPGNQIEAVKRLVSDYLASVAQETTSKR